MFTGSSPLAHRACAVTGIVLFITGCGSQLAPTVTHRVGGSGSNNGGPVVDEPDPPSLGDLAQPGDTVGTFEIALPSVTPFALHGTMPMPAGAYVAPSAYVPFKVRSPDGTLYGAQNETVTRYAKSERGADVIEILARVDRPAGAHAGDRVHYDVVYEPHSSAGCQPTAQVDAMLATPDSIVMRSHDVFGHEYRADLWADGRDSTGSARWFKRGRVSSEVATHEVLLPVTPTSGAEATYAHMMGVHTYLTRWTGEDFITVDLRVHAAFSGKDHTTTVDDPVGAIYFDQLELMVPAGWTILEDVENPYSGPVHAEGAHVVKALVSPIASGALHVLPPMAQFERRVVIARVGSEARALSALRDEGLAFARDGTSGTGLKYFSWWNPITGRYFSQRHALPSLGTQNEPGLRTELAGKLAGLEAQVHTGSAGLFPCESPNLGWAHPWGINQGGMVSGSEIYIYDGVDVAQAASVEGIRYHRLCHRMYTDRQPNVLFDADGRHSREQEWILHSPAGDTLPIWWYNLPMLWAADPFGYSLAPTNQSAAVAALGRNPWYESTLEGYQPIDWQHLVRYTRSAKTLLWLENDTLAKEDLRAQAEGFMFGYSMLPQDHYGNIIPTGMLSMANFAAHHPGNGIAYGRGESWGLDAVLAAYSTQDDAWRATLQPWFHSLLGMLEAGQGACSGVIQASPQYNVFNSQYRCRQSIEAAIMENALVGLRETVFEGADDVSRDRLNQILDKAFYAMVSPYIWSSTDHGPWAMIGVGLFDMSTPLFCDHIPSDGTYGFADHYQPWSSFAYAYELTHDHLFLDKAAEMAGTADLTGTLSTGSLDNWQNKAALLQLVQELHSGPTNP